MIKIVCIFFLCVFCQCSLLGADHLNRCSVTIVNKTNRTVDLYYHDYFYKGIPLHVGKNSSFTLLIEMFPTFIIEADRLQHYYKVSGNNIITFLDGGVVETSGTDSAINTALQKLYNKKFQFRTVSLLSDINKSTSFISYDNQRKLICADAKKEVTGFSFLNDNQKKELFSYIDASYFSSLIAPNAKFNYSYNDSLNKYYPNLYSSLNDKVSFVASAPFIVPYFFAANRYFGNSLSFEEKMLLLDKNLTNGSAKEYIKSKMLIDSMSNQTQGQIFKNLDEFIKDTSIRNTAKAYYLTKIKNRNATNAKNNTLFDSLDKILELDSLLSSNNSKLKLVDFWASWCAPCVEAFKYYPSLMNKYKDEVDFIFISLDEDKHSWKIANDNYQKTIGANSFLLAGGFESPFAKKNRITSIPRALLINKQGKVISSDAPRPNSQQLTALINSNLK